jgi:hypothetical protein
MKFIETTGGVLAKILNEGEIGPEELKKVGVLEHTLVRINLHGDIEVRRTTRWEIIGGLLGDFENRCKQATGLDWA